MSESEIVHTRAVHGLSDQRLLPPAAVHAFKIPELLILKKIYSKSQIFKTIQFTIQNRKPTFFIKLEAFTSNTQRFTRINYVLICLFKYHFTLNSNQDLFFWPMQLAKRQ